MHPEVPSLDSAVTNHYEGRFFTSHVPALTEILASSAGKWEELCIVLHLPDKVRKDLQKKQHSSNITCLNQLLTEWVLGGDATQENLEKALGSRTVGLGAEAKHLKENLKRFGVEQPPKQHLSYQPIEAEAEAEVATESFLNQSDNEQPPLLIRVSFDPPPLDIAGASVCSKPSSLNVRLL